MKGGKGKVISSLKAQIQGGLTLVKKNGREELIRVARKTEGREGSILKTNPIRVCEESNAEYQKSRKIEALTGYVRTEGGGGQISQGQNGLEDKRVVGQAKSRDGCDTKTRGKRS